MRAVAGLGAGEVCRAVDEVESFAAGLFGKQLVTKQTDAAAHTSPHQVLLTPGIPFEAFR